MPGLQVLDAVANGTVECGHTYSGYYVGKNPALIFDGSLPFGLTARQHNAWYMFGDGKKLIDEIYDGIGIVSIPMGNTGGQTFGWFRKEIKSPADFNGIKMRVAGFGGRVLAEARRRAAADRGRRHLSGAGEGHDRCRRMGRPARRREARLPQGREVHAHPGRAGAVANNCLYINKAAWAELPPSYQAMLRAACAYALMEMLAGYDARNAKAIARVVAQGAVLTVLTPETLRALRTALEQVLDEEAAKSEQFKKVLDNWRAFRAEQHRWFSIADARTEMSVYALTAAGTQ